MQQAALRDRYWKKPRLDKSGEREDKGTGPSCPSYPWMQKWLFQESRNILSKMQKRPILLGHMLCNIVTGTSLSETGRTCFRKIVYFVVVMRDGKRNAPIKQSPTKHAYVFIVKWYRAAWCSIPKGSLWPIIWDVADRI